MKTRTLLVASVAAVLAVLLTPRLISQDTRTIETQIRPEAEPGPEHWLLERLAGEWKAAARLFRGPEHGYGADAGTATFESIAGKRFLLGRTTLGVEPFQTEHVLILGFDRRAAQYTALLFDSFETSYQRAAGVWNPDTKQIVMQGEDIDPRSGARARFRVVVHLDVEQQFRVEILAEVPDGEPVQMIEMTYRRP
jgi:hypothetical protein